MTCPDIDDDPKENGDGDESALVKHEVAAWVRSGPARRPHPEPGAQ